MFASPSSHVCPKPLFASLMWGCQLPSCTWNSRQLHVWCLWADSTFCIKTRLSYRLPTAQVLEPPTWVSRGAWNSSMRSMRRSKKTTEPNVLFTMRRPIQDTVIYIRVKGKENLRHSKITSESLTQTIEKNWEKQCHITAVLRMWAQSCDPVDCNLPGSSGHGILQTRILEWVAISLSRESSQGSNICLLHCRQILYHSNITYIMYLSIYELIFIHANCHLRGDEENESSYLCMLLLLLLLSCFSHVRLCVTQ